ALNMGMIRANVVERLSDKRRLIEHYYLPSLTQPAITAGSSTILTCAVSIYLPGCALGNRNLPVP
ncbi:hypothetical protein, partial [Enterobacter hormaechei]|uniref:hypothetical protein n=1 Tax=Enterobacter hormaechei TaxID=158836 RepID=UPI001D031CE7